MVNSWLWYYKIDCNYYVNKNIYLLWERKKDLLDTKINKQKFKYNLFIFWKHTAKEIKFSAGSVLGVRASSITSTTLG